MSEISEEISEFLSDLKFFTFQIIELLEEIPSLETALNGITGLEVLHIQNGCDTFVWLSVSLDSLFSHITNHPFLSSINILAASEGDHSHFKVSKDVLDNRKQALDQRSRSCNHHIAIQAGGIIILENGKNRKLLDLLPYRTSVRNAQTCTHFLNMFCYNFFCILIKKYLKLSCR